MNTHLETAAHQLVLSLGLRTDGSLLRCKFQDDPSYALGVALAQHVLREQPQLGATLAHDVPVVVVRLPYMQLSEGVADGLKAVSPLFGSRDAHGNLQCDWLEYLADNDRRRPLPQEHETICRALRAREPIIGVSSDPARYLPEGLLRVANVRVDVPPITSDVLSSAIELSTGIRPDTDLPDDLAERVTPDIFALAARGDDDAESFVRRLVSLTDVPEQPSSEPITLEQLSGLDEIVVFGNRLKRDMRDFAKGVIKWTRVDSSILVVGEPGCGKNLAAEAMAASCGLPFFATSFAEWQACGHLGDMLKAMRDAFDRARSAAPCVLFIDEIDAVGDRAKFSGPNASYAVQVMNAFLEQMDGTQKSPGVVVIAATNYPQRLDRALLRPGRFGTIIHIPVPNRAGLAGILRYHLRDDLQQVDLSHLALLGQGATGAVAARWVQNARRTARGAGRAMIADDLLSEIGARKSEISPVLRHRVAVHEAGHALMLTVQRQSLDAVSIMPSQHSLGAVHATLGAENALTRDDVEARLRFLLAGHAAEEEVLGAASSGVGDTADGDLAQANMLALRALGCWAMRTSASTRFLWLGDLTPARVPQLLAAFPGLATEVAALLKEAHRQATVSLKANRPALNALVARLLAEDALDGASVVAIVRQAQADAALSKFVVQPVRGAAQ